MLSLGLRLPSRRPDSFKFSVVSSRLQYYSGTSEVTDETPPRNGNGTSLFLTASVASIGSRMDSGFHWYRSFSAMADHVSQSESSREVRLRPLGTPDQVSNIIELVRNEESELAPKLDGMNVTLSKVSILKIFQVLTSEKVSGLCFFKWIQNWQPKYSNDSDVCSLVFDNCGRIDDFDGLQGILEDFRIREVCLNRKAFEFLGVMSQSESPAEKATNKVIELLNRAGGICRSSGIPALIEMFCESGNFEMATYVIAKTQKKLSYFNILIKKKCQIGDFDGVNGILGQMIQVGCLPTCQTFNYILSYLCKKDQQDAALQMIKDMHENNAPPDALTYEILILYLSRHGNLDFALELLGEMASSKIEPRISTHTALLKVYFYSNQYEEAHKYIVTAREKHSSSSNVLYSVLASLYQKSGNCVAAQNVLSEMMDKGFKPWFPVFKKVKLHLLKSGREELARILESQFSQFTLPASPESG